MISIDEKIKKMNGVIGVINTPFTDSNEIDVPSLKRYVDYYIENGVVGFLVPAIAAEVNKLTYEERNLIVETVVEHVNGKVPVIGGASAEDQYKRIEYVKRLNSIGCDGVLVNINFVDEESFIKQIDEISNEEPGFLVIQDWDFHGYGIPIETIVKIFESNEYFKSYKIEVVPAGVKYTEIIKATGGKLHVSGGWASSQMIEALDRGVNAFMSTILPDIYSRIFLLYSSGRREDAKLLFHQVLPVLAFSHQHPDISIHFNKRMVHKQGLYSTANVRQPILPFDDHHRKVADELIEYGINLSKEIKEYL